MAAPELLQLECAALRAPGSCVATLRHAAPCSMCMASISPSPPHPPSPHLRCTQACRWQFLAFSGTFDVQLAVQEDADAMLLVFRLVRSSFMNDFEGRWQVRVRISCMGGLDCTPCWGREGCAQTGGAAVAGQACRNARWGGCVWLHAVQRAWLRRWRRPQSAPLLVLTASMLLPLPSGVRFTRDPRRQSDRACAWRQAAHAHPCPGVDLHKAHLHAPGRGYFG